MSELKTKPTKASVQKFINAIDNPVKKEDCKILLKMMTEVTGEQPVMWGSSIVGFGGYHYKYASGREGDWFKVGFSPRKQALTIYLMGSYIDETKIKDLGKFKNGKGCLYIKKLEDVDQTFLKKVITESVKKLK